jgi:hypothetical protein
MSLFFRDHQVVVVICCDVVALFAMFRQQDSVISFFFPKNGAGLNGRHNKYYIQDVNGQHNNYIGEMR